jgi:hypothetical protein
MASRGTLTWMVLDVLQSMIQSLVRSHLLLLLRCLVLQTEVAVCCVPYVIVWGLRSLRPALPGCSDRRELLVTHWVAALLWQASRMRVRIRSQCRVSTPEGGLAVSTDES